MKKPTFSEKRIITPEEALDRLPIGGTTRFAEMLEHGSLTVEIYTPRGVDTQEPHTRDEVYVVLTGTGNFLVGGKTLPFKSGDLLFVPAGVEHRFVDFTEGLIVWVIFYGPEGGERVAR